MPKSAVSSLSYISTIIEWIITILLIPLFPKYFTYPIKKRISGADFIWDLAKFSAERRLKVFLLGGAPTIAERTALQLQSKIPDLRIAGVNSKDPKDTAEIVSQINKSKADILLVAFGAPKQEFWLSENLNKTDCKIGIGVGGSFDFIAGVKKRAPAWMQKSGLEWLYRLISQPSRILRQMALPKFLYLVLKDKLSNS
jgi:N-acetylglucosaminyldiphosphoundecaprenol N-acetyl-beta-D-mannosaminyltransferase